MSNETPKRLRRCPMPEPMTDARLEEAKRLVNDARTHEMDVDLVENLVAEVCRLRAAHQRLQTVCAEAAVTLREVLERYDDELTGSARGDVDNVRLDLLLASEKAKP